MTSAWPSDLALIALSRLWEAGPCQIVGPGRPTVGDRVNFTTARALVAHGLAANVDTLLGPTLIITERGRLALEAASEKDRQNKRPYAAVKRKRYRKMQPFGALCIECKYRPAMPHKKFPHLAGNYCSDRCRQIGSHRRRSIAERGMANEIRVLLGMPADRNGQFTVPELRVLVRHVRRLTNQPVEPVRPHAGKRQAARRSA